MERVISLFEAERDRDQAEPMMKYMKNQFPFIGIKSPARNQLMKKFYKESGILKERIQHSFVLDLWEKAEREYQYAALDYIGKSLKRFEKNDIILAEQLITSKSWWDTVDGLAPNLVAELATEYPEIIPETIEGWAFGDNLWLRRTAILFQLKYKEHTDDKLLYKYILRNADSKEFFIQKAIGWALREYSKTNQESVRDFILNNRLSKLSVREGSKYINQ